MQETPVYFSNETGKAQYLINLQELMQCMGDSGQAGLIKIEGFENPAIKNYFPGDLFKNASEKFHEILLSLKKRGILRKEDLITFHTEKYNNAIIFLSKKRDANYYIMHEMDILLYRLYDTFYTELAQDYRTHLPWHDSFNISGSFLLLDAKQELGEFIAKSIKDADENLFYHQKKYSLRKQEIINHIILHQEIEPRYLKVIDLKSNKTVLNFSFASFKSDTPWMKNSWTAFLIASEEGFDIELDDAAHHTILKDYTRHNTTPIVLFFTAPWSQNQTQRTHFLNKLEILWATYPQKKLLSLPMAHKSELDGFIKDLEIHSIFTDIILSLDLFTVNYDIESTYLPQVKGIEIKRDLFLTAIHNQSTRSILEKVITIASSNNCEVIINGIENKEELDFAKAMNATQATGYFLQGTK